MFDRNINFLYLDLDGVLADFDSAAMPLMGGMAPEKFEETFGSGKFWKTINQKPDFFSTLPVMVDAIELYDAVVHLRPPILTGIPSNMDRYSNQKVEWVRKHFSSYQRVFCCPSKSKSAFAIPGDILIDDRTKYKHLWEEAGGTYIVHTSAKDSIKQLKELGVI